MVFVGGEKEVVNVLAVVAKPLLEKSVGFVVRTIRENKT